MSLLTLTFFFFYLKPLGFTYSRSVILLFGRVRDHLALRKARNVFQGKYMYTAHTHISDSFRKCMDSLKSTNQSYGELQKVSPSWNLTFLRSQLGRTMVVSWITFSKHLNKGCFGKIIQLRYKAVEILYLSLSSYVNLITESHLNACKIQILIHMLKNCSELKVININ